MRKKGHPSRRDRKAGISRAEISGIETCKIKRIPESMMRKIAEALQKPISYFEVSGQEERSRRYCLNCGESYFLNSDDDLNEKLPKLYDKCPSCQSKKTEWLGNAEQLFYEISVRMIKLGIIFRQLEFNQEIISHEVFNE